MNARSAMEPVWHEPASQYILPLPSHRVHQGRRPGDRHGQHGGDNPGSGFVNHSSYIDISDNVAFDVQGQLCTEAGEEMGNSLTTLPSDHRMGEATSRLGLQDFGHERRRVLGCKNPGRFRDRKHSRPETTVTPPVLFKPEDSDSAVQQIEFAAANLADPAIADGAARGSPSQSVPMLAFDHNVGYASGLGLSIWY